MVDRAFFVRQATKPPKGEESYMSGTGRPGPECSIGLLLDNATDDDRQIVQDVLDDQEGYTHVFAAEVFTEWQGERYTRSVVGHHRNEKCRCSLEDE